MTSFRYPVARPPGADRHEALVTFRPTRSMIHRVQLEGMEACAQSTVGRRFHFASPPSAWGECLDISADYDGEPISLLEVSWREPCGEPSPYACGEGSRLEERREAARALLGDVDVAVPAAVLGVTTGRQTPDYAKAFFLALDRATHPGLQDAAEPWPSTRMLMLQKSFPPLKDRLRRRWTAMRDFVAGGGSFDAEDGRPLPAPLPSSAAVPDLRDVVPDADITAELVALMLTTIRTWYPGEPHGFERAGLRWAMERFAAGRLGPCVHDVQHGTWSAQPDSANIFMFAEFAFLAMDQEVEPEACKALARIFTGIEPIYRRSYGHHGMGCTPAGPEKQGVLLSFRMLGPPALELNVLADEGWLQKLRLAHDGDDHPLEFRHGAHLWHTCPAGIESDI